MSLLRDLLATGGGICGIIVSLVVERDTNLPQQQVFATSIIICSSCGKLALRRVLGNHVRYIGDIFVTQKAAIQFPNIYLQPDVAAQ